MAVVVDRVQETSTTLGTAAYVLGGAVSGFRTFAAALSTGAVVPYAAFDASGGGWETGLGTFNAAPNTLARTTIRASSNAGAAVAWDSGTRQVFISPTAADGIQAMLRTALGGGVAGQPLIARGAGDAAWGGGAAVMTSSFLSGTASLTLDPACIALDIIAGGAGGGGGPGVLCSGYGSGGGAGGGGTIVGPVLVRVADLPSTTLTVIVGAAGAAVAGLTTGGGSTSPSTSGVPGGASSVVSGNRCGNAVINRHRAPASRFQRFLAGVPNMRNAIAHAGKTQRRIVSAWVGPAFAQDDAPAAHAQWRPSGETSPTSSAPRCHGSPP